MHACEQNKIRNVRFVGIIHVEDSILTHFCISGFSISDIENIDLAPQNVVFSSTRTFLASL